MAITSIKELMEDSTALQKFNDAPDEARNKVLESISNKFADPNVPDEAKVGVVNKVLLAAKDIPPAWKDVPAEALSNIGPDAISLAKNIWAAARHPQQTAENLEKMIVGGFQKLIPGEQQQEKSFDAIVDFAKNRYIGDENLRRTISQEPLQFFSDIAGLLSGAGALLKVAGGAKAANTISKVAKTIDPMRQATKVIAKAGSEVVTPLQRSFVKTGIKFPSEGGKRIRHVKKRQLQNKLADAAIEQGRRVDQLSLDAISDDIIDLRMRTDDILKAGDRAGVRIRKDRIVTSIDKEIKALDNFPIEDPIVSQQLNTLKGIRKDIVSKRGTIGDRLESQLRDAIVSDTHGARKTDILANMDELIRRSDKRPRLKDTIREGETLRKFRAEVNEMRNITSRENLTSSLNDFIEREAVLTPTQVQSIKKIKNRNYKPNVQSLTDTIKLNADDKIRFAVKEALEDEFPVLRNLNDKQKVLLDLEEAIAKRLNTLESAPTFPSKQLITAGAGSGGAALAAGIPLGAVATGVGAFTGMTVLVGKVVNSPNVQIRLAEALNSANKALARGGKLSRNVINQGTFQAGRASEEIEQNNNRNPIGRHNETN